MLLEFGIVLPKNLNRLRTGVPEVLEDADNGLPDRLRALIHDLYADLKRLDARIEALNAALTTFARQDPLMQLLLTIPGTGQFFKPPLCANVGETSPQADLL